MALSSASESRCNLTLCHAVRVESGQPSVHRSPHRIFCLPQLPGSHRRNLYPGLTGGSTCQILPQVPGLSRVDSASQTRRPPPAPVSRIARPPRLSPRSVSGRRSISLAQRRTRAERRPSRALKPSKPGAKYQVRPESAQKTEYWRLLSTPAGPPAAA